MFGMIVGILFGLYVIAAVINVVGVIIGAVFSGIAPKKSVALKKKVQSG